MTVTLVHGRLPSQIHVTVHVTVQTYFARILDTVARFTLLYLFHSHGKPSWHMRAAPYPPGKHWSTEVNGAFPSSHSFQDLRASFTAMIVLTTTVSSAQNHAQQAHHWVQRRAPLVGFPAGLQTYTARRPSAHQCDYLLGNSYYRDWK